MFFLTRHLLREKCGNNEIALLCHGAMKSEYNKITFNKFSVVSLVERKQHKTKIKQKIMLRN